MKRLLAPPLLLAALIASGTTGAHAQGIGDAAGDFLPTYTGPQNGDVDVLGAFVGYNPGNDTFNFSGSFAGAVGTTAGAFYVWGLDRGTGTERFLAGSPSLGAGVKFDAVVFLRPDGTARVTTFVGAVGTGVEIGAGTATIAGNTISGSISGALLGSTGFAKSDYTWNLWPRTGASSNTISDFAPDGTNVAVAVVPEPATFALMGLGLGLVGMMRRKGARA
jgi:PEP-CTERM motif